MTTAKLAVVVLAAGKGTRMKSARPKVLHPLAGKTMIAHVLDTLAELAPAEQVVVVGAGMDSVAEAVAPRRCAVQDPPLGTGHAVMAAVEAMADFRTAGDSLLVAFGDTPLITSETLATLVEARAAPPHPELVLLGFRPKDPSGYGRILTDSAGQPTAIVEHRDASPAEREIGLCNGGLMLIDAARLPGLLARLGNDNAKGEYYLTDLAALAHADGLAVAVREAPEEQIMGINSKAELAAAEAVMQDRLRARAMDAGVTLVDPASVWLSADTRLAADVVVEPNVVFGPAVTVGEGAAIRAFSHLEGAEVSAGAVIGPYARLRPGSRIGRGARVGNFVETKNAVLGEGAKANHLTYLGDSSVGAGANVGAGTITCNYDGFGKHRTEIGAGAFIGSNTALVAPVTVGEGAIVGAGSTVTKDVPDQAVRINRAPQTTKEGAAARFRERRKDTSKAG